MGGWLLWLCFVVPLSPGVNCWEVVIEKCVSKNIFVGICTSNALLTNYVGSDRNGWGYLANRAMWHNKASAACCCGACYDPFCISLVPVLEHHGS